MELAELMRSDYTDDVEMPDRSYPRYQLLGCWICSCDEWRTSEIANCKFRIWYGAKGVSGGACGGTYGIPTIGRAASYQWRLYI